MMKQKWNNVCFAHWSVPVDAIRPHIPVQLEIDTYDGKAWIGVILFILDGIYMKRLPIRFVRPFPEINVRTYVTYNGKPGIYFLSLDAKHWSTYTIARSLFHLPYIKTNVRLERSGTAFQWSSEHIHKNRGPNQLKRFFGTFTPSAETFTADPDSLVHFLTERYRFYCANRKGHLFCGEVHHDPWELRKTSASVHVNRLFELLGLSLEGKPLHLHYSDGTVAAFDMLKKLN